MDGNQAGSGGKDPDDCETSYPPGSRHIEVLNSETSYPPGSRHIEVLNGETSYLPGSRHIEVLNGETSYPPGSRHIEVLNGETSYPPGSRHIEVLNGETSYPPGSRHIELLNGETSYPPGSRHIAVLNGETSYPPGSRHIELLNGLSHDSQLINLDDIMDVVYLYKCKFCSVSAPSAQEVTEHVLSVHLEHRPGWHMDEVQAAARLALGSRLSGEAEHALVSRLSGEAVYEESASNFVSDDADRLERSVVEVTQPVSSVTHSVSSVTQPVSSVTQPVTQPESSGSQAQLVANSESMVFPADKCDDSCGLGIDMPIESDGGDIGTKELFLCGQCSLGYNSIDECKQHMVRDHNIPLNDMTTESPSQPGYADVTLASSNKVSVGTQAILYKKPGRKRKLKTDEDAGKTEEKLMVSEEDSFESLIITEPFESSSRRRIKPPRALERDYYLGQPKLRRRHTTKDRYPISCRRSGCMAKFREDKALRIHLSCHSDAADDDAFKCCECVKTFPQWRPLRVHLWKVHGVDTDLYACSTCDFRADTTHKMETHEQIHSDERPYTCKVCGQGFKQHSQLCNHVTIHRRATDQELNKWYTNKQCDVCSRTFSNQKCLRKHIEVTAILSSIW